MKLFDSVLAVVDRATVFAMAARGWNVVSGLASVFVISWSFSPEAQGFYFTFASVLTLQTLVELGWGNVIQQFVSHEWAYLSLDSQGRIQGEKASRQKLAGLARLSFHWYGVVSLLVFLGLGTAGHLYFWEFAGPTTSVHWRAAWWTVCLLAGLTLLLTPVFSLLEGCNRVSDVYGLQLTQAVVSRTSLWVAMLLGGGLWSIAAGKAASALVGAAFLVGKSRVFFRSMLSEPPGERLSWRRELWPLQWKVAVSWLGGYLMFSLFTPVLFAFHGSVVAGQMGMTLAVAGALSSICYAIVGTRVPRLAMAAARGDYENLDGLFRLSTRAAVLVAGFGALAFWTVLYTLRLIESPLADRFLSPFATGLLLAAAAIQQIRYAMGSYLRAHKKEPYLILSLVEAAATVLGLSVLGAWYGAIGMAGGFLALTLILIVPAVVIFRRSRRQWHAVVPAARSSERLVDGVTP